MNCPQRLGHAAGEQTSAGDLRSQYCRHLVGLNRPADQKSLREIAVAATQEFELRQGFHTFGSDLDIEALCHRDRSTNDALVAVILLDIRDQRLIEHETVDKSVVERFERYVAGAEVVERNSNTESAQIFQGSDFGRALSDNVAIADLKFDWVF